MERLQAGFGAALRYQRTYALQTFAKAQLFEARLIMTQQYVQALERLAFELVPGEQRFFVQTPQATLCCAVRRAEVGDQRPQKAIVFVHGAASNASRWEAFVEKTALARSWTLLRFDLRGHGASEGLRPATLERHADDIAAILDVNYESCLHFSVV